MREFCTECARIARAVHCIVGSRQRENSPFYLFGGVTRIAAFPSPLRCAYDHSYPVAWSNPLSQIRLPQSGHCPITTKSKRTNYPTTLTFSTATGGDSPCKPSFGSTLLSSKVAQPTKKPFEIYDSRLIGFTLRVQPSGVRSYYARVGPNRRVPLGP